MQSGMSRKMLVVIAITAAFAMLLTLVQPETSSEPELSEGTDVPEVPSPPPLAAAGNAAAPRPAEPVLAAAAPVAEEDDTPPAAAAPEPPAQQEHADMIEGDQGPVADYRKRYESETRDAKAQEIETKIQTTFQRQPSELFQSVSCHETICRVMLRWSAKRTTDYVLALRRLGYGGIGPNAHFEIPLALSPVTPKDADGVRTVELYLKRR